MPECSVCGGTLICRTCEEAEDYTEAKLILGEGRADAEFFKNLIAENSLTGFQVVRPANGKPAFERRLRAMKVNRHIENVSVLVLVTDSNGDPEEAFGNIARQVQRAEGYPVPEEPLKIARDEDSGYPATVVLTVPWVDVQGNLETLLLDPFKSEWPAIWDRGEDYIAGSPTNDLEVSGRSKALLACMIAAVCRDDPSSAVSHLWHERKGFRPLLRKEVFRTILGFLGGLQ